MNKRKGFWRFLSGSHTSAIRLRQNFSILVLFLLIGCIILQFTYSRSAFAGTLICSQVEHVHSDSCYEPTLICENTDENHEHNETCYESVLTCELEEHQHNEDCYEEEEDASLSSVVTLEADEIQALADEPTAQADTTTTSKVVNPQNTTINLFNYSTGWQDDVGMWDWNSSANTNQWKYGHGDTGINAGSILKFRKGGIDAYTNDKLNEYKNEYLQLLSNKYAGDKQNAIQGIVENKLVNGYPVVSSTFNNNEVQSLSKYSSLNRSLEYLFSVDDEPVTGDGYGNLAGTKVNYKESYGNVQNLLQQDSDGYYYYDSQENFAEFDGVNSFNLYSPSVMNNNASNTRIGQFFPFNSYNSTFENGSMVNCANTNLDHYFGMTLTTTFMQQFGGKTSSGSNAKDMVFEFSGDDDVWVFIDGVLVGDVGGIHEACSLEINFRTGEVSVWSTYGNANKSDSTKVATTTIYQQFVNAGVAHTYNWTKDDLGNEVTFADNTTHTLTFYYLERGNYDSNLSIKYNLINYPDTTIEKVDQYGNAVDGAVFALYQAATDTKTDSSSYSYTDSTGATISYQEGLSATVSLEPSTYGYLTSADGSTIVKPVYIGTTVNGKLTFVDENGNSLSVSDIQNLLGSDKMILREIEVPDGYRRTADQVCLYFEDGYLINPDPYDDGVWPSNQALVTATNQLTLIDETNNKYVSQDYFDPETSSTEGTLFYVVLKRNSEELKFDSIDPLEDWVPVIGNDDQGYEVGTSSKLDDIISMAMRDATVYESDIVFARSSSNSMQLLVTNLPGKINRYFTYMWEQAGSSLENFVHTALEPQYTVAYFWTSANSLEGADGSNTYRVVSHSGLLNDDFIDADDPVIDSAFSTIWGSKLEIPDIVNRLYVQKRDTDGNPVDNTTFALYEVNVDDSGDTEVYTYTATSVDGTSTASVVLNPIKTFDQLVSDINNGTAEVNGSTGFTYQVETDGTIRIYDQSGVLAYNIQPTVNAKGELCVDNTETSGVGTDGYEGIYSSAVGYFDYLREGNYVIREVSVPEGFSYNTAETKVVVNKYGVFANAGTSDDRVDVGNGAGYLTKTMDVFASSASIDETLTWLYTIQRVASGTNFSDLSNLANGLYSSDSGNDPAGYGTETTDDIYHAIVNYLVFARESDNTVFDYRPSKIQADRSSTEPFELDEKTYHFTPINSDSSPTGTGEGLLCLYTDEGWTALEIYQDYALGKTLTIDETNYDDIQGKNLSTLFSNSTFVLYTNEIRANLTLTKTEEDGVTPLEDAKFVFYKAEPVEINDSGEDIYAFYNVASDGTISWLKMTMEDFNALLDSSNYSSGIFQSSDEYGKISYQNLPDGTYTLIEAKAPEGYEKILPQTVYVSPNLTITNYDVENITEKTDHADYNAETSNYQFAATIQDVKESTDITLYKKDSETLLNGAEFILSLVDQKDNERYYYVYDEENDVVEWSSNKDNATVLSSTQTETNKRGEVVLHNLVEGEYTLTEIKSPSGYYLDSSEKKITVKLEKDDSGVYVLNASISGEHTGNEEDGEMVVYNEPYRLGEYGGIGTWMILLAAVILIITGVLVRKKKNNDQNQEST